MDNKIERLIKILGDKLKEKNFSLVTAESCTGGGLAYFITINPKFSFILERGFIVYSSNSKEKLLGISKFILQTFGEVSEQTARHMAEGALKNSNAQISISITGLDADTVKEVDANKKQGLVWISCSGIERKTLTKKFKIGGKRKLFCEKTIIHALETLIKYIE